MGPGLIMGRTTEVIYVPVDFEMDTTNPFTCSFICTDGTNIQEEIVLKSKEYVIKEQEIVSLIPGSLRATCIDVKCVDDGQGNLLVDVNPNTGIGTTVATINYTTRKFTIIDSIVSLTNPVIHIDSALGMNFNGSDTQWVFRTPGNPITPGSFTIQGTSIDYGTITGTANFSGVISGTYMTGGIDYLTGSVWVQFGDWHLKTEYPTPPPGFFEAHLNSDDGLSIWIPTYVATDTIVMNCVIESYLPLDAGLLGLNPVRLPLDGKVPIFKDGSIVLIHDTFSNLFSPDPTAGSQFVCGYTNVAVLELYCSAVGDQYVPETGNYSVNLATGTMTFADPLDLSAYPGPYQAVWRVEDMILASDVQVTGHIALVSQVTHDYDSATALVSSVLPSGDLQSGIYDEFFQTSWSGTWSDNAVGDPPLAQYNLVDYPIVIVNEYAVQERFACIFQTATTVNVVGEHLGVILANAPITANISPINPRTGNPYFVIDKDGWGAGWNTGNVFRFNSVGAGYPYWFCRTTLMGPATEASDFYTLLLRGDSA